MGKLLEFKRKPDIQTDEALEGPNADQALKQVTSLFTKEELDEIRRELEEMETTQHHGG